MTITAAAAANLIAVLALPVASGSVLWQVKTWREQGAPIRLQLEWSGDDEWHAEGPCARLEHPGRQYVVRVGNAGRTETQIISWNVVRVERGPRGKIIHNIVPVGFDYTTDIFDRRPTPEPPFTLAPGHGFQWLVPRESMARDLLRIGQSKQRYAAVVRTGDAREYKGRAIVERLNPEVTKP